MFKEMCHNFELQDVPTSFSIKITKNHKLKKNRESLFTFQVQSSIFPKSLPSKTCLHTLYLEMETCLIHSGIRNIRKIFKSLKNLQKCKKTKKCIQIIFQGYRVAIRNVLHHKITNSYLWVWVMTKDGYIQQ